MRPLLRATALALSVIGATPVLASGSVPSAPAKVDEAKSVEQFAAIYSFIKAGNLSAGELADIFLANHNVYVFAMQSLMAESGSFTGKPSGILSGPTLVAIIQFCHAHDVAALCARGPLTDEAITAIAPLVVDMLAGGTATAKPVPQPKPAPAPEPNKVEAAPAPVPEPAAIEPAPAETTPAAPAASTPVVLPNGELVPNGSFDTDLSGWSAAGSTAPAKVVWKDGEAVTETKSGGVARLVIGIPTTAGKSYTFSYSGTLTTRLGAVQNAGDIKPLNADGRNDKAAFTFVAPGDVVWIGVVDSTDGRTLDNVSLKPSDAQ